MLKNKEYDELIEFISISEDAKKNMPEILTSFFADISHIMASAQTYFENAITGLLENQNIGDSMHSFTTGSNFLRQLSGKIDTFRNVIQYGTQVLPMIKLESFFNPGDIHQEIADMISIYASSRNISISLENPYQNLGGDAYLAFYDIDFLRQILLQFVSSIIVCAEKGSNLELRLLLSDIQSEPLLTPEMSHYLSASIRSKMKMIFQVKYYGITKLDSPKPLDEYYAKVLHSKDGSFVSMRFNSYSIEELHVPCYAIQFDNIVKTVGYYEIPGQMPYTLNERMLFVKNIRFFKVVLVSSKRSMIIDQLKKYLEFWGADASCNFLS